MKVGTPCDKTKGIVCNPMPRWWYDWHANKVKADASAEEIERAEFNKRILADKKPYFMRYIYPAVMKEYNSYIKNTEAKCLRTFRMDIASLLAIPADELTAEQSDFISWYRHKMPVGTNDCTMNRICRRIEREFDGVIRKINSAATEFDYRIMRNGGTEYTDRQYNLLSAAYFRYVRDYREFVSSRKSNLEHGNNDELCSRESFIDAYRKEAMYVCSNEQQLCDILLDICYKHDNTKQFVWDVCERQIVANLLANSGGVIEYPMRDPDGDIIYNGEHFSMQFKEACRWLS